jgi:hypothetical protein
MLYHNCNYISNFIVTLNVVLSGRDRTILNCNVLKLIKKMNIKESENETKLTKITINQV